MKKTIYSSLALGAVLALASCASDEPLGNNQNDGSLSFTVSLPGQNTRFAEGTTVDRLYYSVFDTEGKIVLHDSKDWPAGSLTTTVTLQLVANQSYDIVFFADNKEAEGKGYTYNAETAQFSVTYGQDMVNNDKFDAFVKNEKGVVADGNAKTVTLTRPFAQLNIGTNDLTEDAVAKYGLSNFSSTLGIAKENVLSGINFLDGTTTAQAADLSFAIADFSQLPPDEFPVSGYSYIEMNYLLVAPTEGETANLINATYTINGKAGAATVNTLNLASTPVRQNYRTNIYGSLLTTQNNFNVEINPAFKDNINVSLTPVKTQDEFIAALQNNGSAYVPAGVEIDLSTMPATTFNNPVYLRLDGTLNNLNTTQTFTGDVTISGTGTINTALDSPNTPLMGFRTEGNAGFDGVRTCNVSISGITINAPENTNTGTFSNTGIINTWYCASFKMDNVTIISKTKCIDVKQDRCAPIVLTNCNLMSTGYEVMTINNTAQYGGDSSSIILKDCNLKGIGFVGSISGWEKRVKFILDGTACIATGGNPSAVPGSVVFSTNNVDLQATDSYLYHDTRYIFMFVQSTDLFSFKNCMTNKNMFDFGDNVATDDPLTYSNKTVTKEVFGKEYKFTLEANGNFVKGD